ncbi:MAG: SIS domain-containing protein [Burkholderiales bacterium]|nr:SIS domain-containing protein [Burkholderiales bacterium]MDE2398849.1 SIS domain-containing protein [Burkholderiales bacterium]MDE2457094.1 SIS domain-containing protein [Burkholderiales bacterium]
MTSVARRYFDGLAERLERLRDTQCEAIEAAAELCAASIAAGKLVFTFGTGHGAIPALESFPRTGTIVGFRPIVETAMLSFHRVWGDTGARQYRFIHAAEGYGRAIMASHQTDPGDGMILFSHSGINAVIIDIALECKRLGIRLVAVTSLGHSQAAASRHSSGKRLFELADVVIDSGGALGDAALRLDGLEHPVGAQSTSLTVAVTHAIEACTAERLIARGIEPMVMLSPNTAGKQAATEQNERNYAELWRRLRAR